MAYYFWSAVINAFTSFAVSAHIISKNFNKKLNKLFVLFAFSVGFWAACYAAWIHCMDLENAVGALFWIRLAMIGSIIIPVAFTEFVTCLVNKEKQYRIFRLFNVCFGTGLLFFSLSRYFIKDIGPILNFKYWPIPGIVFYPFHLWFGFNFILAHYLLIISIREAKDPSVRRRNFSVFLGTLIGFIGGMTNHFLWYRIPIPPFGNVLVTVYIVMVAYSIVRYKFLDIEVIIRKTVIFAGLASFIFGVFALVTFLIQDVLNTYVHTGRFTITFISVFLIVFCYEPLRKFLVEITDRFLFQKKYDYHKLLKENAKQIAFIHSLDEIAKQVSAYLVKQGRIKNAGILMRNDQNAFELKYPLGYGGKKSRPQMVIPESHLLINLLSTQNGPVNFEDLEKLAKDQKIDTISHGQALEVMRILKAEVLIPSFLGRVENGKNSVEKVLSNIIVLGGKKSDEPYTDEDLDVFFTVAQESAIAAENARLVNVLVLEREEKIKAQKTAELVNYTRTFKHEGGNTLVAVESAAINMRNHVTDRLTKLKNQIQTRLSEIEIKLFDSIHNLVVKNATEIEHAGQKMGMIMDTVVGALSADESMKQEVYFRIPWETAKRNAKIEYDFRFDVKTPERFRIYGNTILLERVFQNFFTNSRDAIANSADKLIFLNGGYREYEGKQVTWFEYWDAGPGIPETLFEKVFEQGFSTKPKPLSATSIESGHGYGLYVCRKYIEEHHAGKIWLQKNDATGRSKFVFWLPFLESGGTDGSK